MATPWFRGVIRAAGISQFLSNSSTAATLKWRGNHVIFSTAAGKLHTLGAPKNVGDEVSIVCRRATTTLTAFVILPTGYAFQRTSNSTGATFRKATMNAGNQALVLRSISTAKVAILSNVNSVTFGTT